MGSEAKSTLKVGDRIRFVFGSSEVEGTVVEDRGPLARGGHKLYRVRIPLSEVEETLEMELPEADMVDLRKIA